MSGAIYKEEKLLGFLHRAAKFTRADFYLGKPPFRKELGNLCRIGYIGPRFRPGGIVLVGHSPNSGEKRGKEIFVERDRRLVAKMKAFRDNGSSQALADLMEEERRETQYWRLSWAISGSLSRLGCNFEEVAIINLLPFTAYDAERPALGRSSCPTWPKVVSDFLQPWLDATQPGTVIWLGKDAYSKAKRHWPAVPVDAVVNRARNLSQAEKFRTLEVKIASGLIRTGGAPSNYR
jgi:hypothetical protein